MDILGVTSATIYWNKVRETIEAIIDQEEPGLLDEIGFTPQAKKVIQLAKDETQSMKHHYVGIEHLLLGFVGEGKGIAAGVLERMGVTIGRVRAETIKVLDE